MAGAKFSDRLTELPAIAAITATTAAASSAVTASTSTAASSTTSSAPTTAAATTESATTPTGPTCAATAEPAAAAAARRSFACFIDRQRASIEILAVKCIDRRLGFLLARHLDESETTGLARHSIGHYLDADGLHTSSLKRATDAVLRRMECQIPYVQSLAHLTDPLCTIATNRLYADRGSCIGPPREHRKRHSPRFSHHSIDRPSAKPA